jgi:hypothetical protein
MTMTRPQQPMAHRPANRWLQLTTLFGLGTVAAVAPMVIFRSPGQPVAIAPLGTNLAAQVQVAPPRLPISLANGTHVLPPQKTGGYSQLTIENGNPTDALVKLVDQASGQTVRLVYVQSKQEATLDNLETGTYDVKFALGRDWDESTQSFRYQPSFVRFEEPMIFKVERSGNREYWTTYRVTLHRVAGGTAETESLSEAEF